MTEVCMSPIRSRFTSTQVAPSADADDGDSCRTACQMFYSLFRLNLCREDFKKNNIQAPWRKYVARLTAMQDGYAPRTGCYDEQMALLGEPTEKGREAAQQVSLSDRTLDIQR